MLFFKSLVPATVLVCGSLAAVCVSATEPPVVTPLMTKDLPEMPGKEALVLSVRYPPGAADPVHVHDAHAFVYVLKGSIVMQVKGGEPATLKPGQTFYEAPSDLHVVGRNASSTEQAEFVVVLVKNKGAPALIEADLPPVDALTEDSDYSEYLSAWVSEDQRRAALRKLFHMAKHNVTDGLVVYAGDRRTYTPLGDTVTADMRREFERSVQRTTAAASAAVQAPKAHRTTTADAQESPTAPDQSSDEHG